MLHTGVEGYQIRVGRATAPADDLRQQRQVHLEVGYHHVEAVEMIGIDQAGEYQILRAAQFLHPPGGVPSAPHLLDNAIAIVEGTVGDSGAASGIGLGEEVLAPHQSGGHINLFGTFPSHSPS